MLTDLRLAVRSLIRDRSFSVAALCALTLGIAANATMFAIVNAIFIRDLPFTEPDRIVGIETRRVVGAETDTTNVSYLDLQELRATARLFEGIAGVNPTTMTLAGEQRTAERHSGAYLSANGLKLLGVQPAMGRDFTADDDRRGAEPVAILGHDLWQARFAGDPAILGRVVRVDGIAATVIGVMPDGFGFPQVAELWVPLAQFNDPAMNQRDARVIEAFGRRRAGVTNEQAQTDLEGVLQGLARLHPDTNAGTHAVVIPYRETMIGQPLTALFGMLFAAVGCLLLIACANVANLLLARGANRAREMALRLSLGASRSRLVRQMLIESLVLAGTAGAVALPLAAFGTQLFARGVMSTDPPYFLDFSTDMTVIAAVGAICAGTAFLFGLVPAVHASGISPAGALAEAGHGTAGAPRTRRWSGALVVAQLALGLILLAGAGVLARNIVGRLLLDPGIDTTGLLTMKLELPARVYPTADGQRALYERLESRLGTIAGVRATLATWAPLAGGGSRRIAIDGRPVAEDTESQPRATGIGVGARYFETLGIAATRGRTLTADDASAGRLAAVVNEEFVARHFPTTPPLGARLLLSPRRGPDSTDWLTIVGVVPNVRQEEADPREVEAVVYIPHTVAPLPFTTILARSPLDTGIVTAAVRREVQQIDPDLALFDVSLLDDAVDPEATLMGVIVSMLSVFAVIAASLAAIGLYALTAYTASKRTREIGIRLALGARSVDIRWLVTRRAAAHVGLGLAIGFTGAAVTGQLLQGIFESVDGHDPLALGAVAVLMLLIGVGAAWLPARRAIRINPVHALRAE